MKSLVKKRKLLNGKKRVTFNFPKEALEEFPDINYDEDMEIFPASFKKSRLEENGSDSENVANDSNVSSDGDGDLVAELTQIKREEQQKHQKIGINKKAEMERRISMFKKVRKFMESLEVTNTADLSYEGEISDDFAREAAFMKQAQCAVCVALPKLHSLKIPIFRPDDYFAEMAKSDQHMQKVRHRILNIQKDNEERDAAKRLREEKRFALKTQNIAEERKRKEKRRLMDAVKKHRKGMKAQLETLLNNQSNLYDEDDQRNQKGKRMSRHVRDKKYGFGGKKKRSKQNDKLSFEDPFAGRKKKNGPNIKKGKFKRSR